MDFKPEGHFLSSSLIVKPHFSNTIPLPFSSWDPVNMISDVLLQYNAIFKETMSAWQLDYIAAVNSAENI